MPLFRPAIACLLVAACHTHATAPQDVGADAGDASEVANIVADASVDARRDAPDEAPVVRVLAPPASVRGSTPSSSLRRAEAERIAAERTYVRIEQLRALGELSQRDLDDAESRRRSATAEVARLRGASARIHEASDDAE